MIIPEPAVSDPIGELAYLITGNIAASCCHKGGAFKTDNPRCECRAIAESLIEDREKVAKILGCSLVGVDQTAAPTCHCGKDGHPIGSVNCPVHGYRAVPVRTLRWWRELVDLNPSDLAPRLDAMIAEKSTP